MWTCVQTQLSILILHGRTFSRPRVSSPSAGLSVRPCQAEPTTLLLFVTLELTLFFYPSHQLVRKKNRSEEERRTKRTSEVFLESQTVLQTVQHSVGSRQTSPLIIPAVMRGEKAASSSLSYSRAALTPAGCRSHRSPAGGAERACRHGDPDP